MANFTVFGSDSTAETLLNGEEGFVAQNGQLVVNGADAVTASGAVNLGVLGSIASLTSNAVDFDGVSFKMSVGQNGYVGSVNTIALDLNATSFVDIDNAGMISSANSQAIDIDDASANAFIYNSGEIVGDTAINASIGSGQMRLTNHGNISGRNTGVDITAQAADVTNTGTMGEEIPSGSDGFEFGGSSGTLTSNTLSLFNSGLINGGVRSDNAVDSIVNMGTIVGGVLLAAGDDTFDGRGGTVTGTVSGGLGDDTFIVDDAGIQLSENVSQGTDVVESYASAFTLADNIENMFLMGGEDIDGEGNNGGNRIEGNSGNNDISGLGGNDQLYGRNGDDALYGFTGLDLLNGGDGNDYLNGGADTDTLGGALGDDLMYGGDGNDNMFGNGGSDRMYGDSGNDTMNGQQDNDIVNGGSGDDTMTGGDGIDLMGGGLGNDVMAGDAGHDNMYGNGGNDNMNGGEGNDFMEGHDGNDVMRGSSGNDRINGGLGDDNLGGDSGADRFIFGNGWGDDIIADFENGLDIIDMSNVAGVNSFADLTVTFSAGSTFVSYEGDEIRLFAVNIANIGAEDFLFG